jgi:hypothetical protein
VSTTEKPDPDRAARFFAQLVGDEEAARVQSLSDEELQAEMAREGHSIAEVPSYEALMARVAARAGREGRTGLPTKPVVPLRRPSRTRLWLLLAAALAVVLVVIAFTYGQDRIAHPNHVPSGAP